MNAPCSVANSGLPRRGPLLLVCICSWKCQSSERFSSLLTVAQLEATELGAMILFLFLESGDTVVNSVCAYLRGKRDRARKWQGDSRSTDLLCTFHLAWAVPAIQASHLGSTAITMTITSTSQGVCEQEAQVRSWSWESNPSILMRAVGVLADRVNACLWMWFWLIAIEK